MSRLRVIPGSVLILVMPGLVPGIHVSLVLTVLTAKKTWMAGTSPAMTDGNDGG
jgi:hypothetical protein